MGNLMRGAMTEIGSRNSKGLKPSGFPPAGPAPPFLSRSCRKTMHSSGETLFSWWGWQAGLRSVFGGKHVFYLNTINLWQCKMAMANYPCVDGLCLRLDDQSCAWIFHGDKSHSGQCNLQETRTTILWRMFARISWCFHIHVYIYILWIAPHW